MRKLGFKAGAVVLAAAAIVGATMSAHADVTFDTSGTGADGYVITASATFHDLGSGKFQITLANTSPGDTFGISEVLYALTFNGGTVSGISSQNAPVGSTVWHLNTTPITSQTVGSVALPTYSTTWARTTSPQGLTALGPPPGPPNQNEDGLISGFRGTITDGLANHEHNPFIQNSIVFVMNGTLGNISDVQFGWGTTPTYTPGTPVPEPTTMVAGALLLLPFGASTIRVLRRNKSA